MAISEVNGERPAKKAKKERGKDEVVVDVKELSSIAHPLAGRKLLKKLHKVIKKATASEGIRKGEKGCVQSDLMIILISYMTAYLSINDIRLVRDRLRRHREIEMKWSSSIDNRTFYSQTPHVHYYLITMGWFSRDSNEAQAYETYQNTPDDHKAKLSHELISSAAAYSAANGYEKHVQKNGKPQSHAQAKALLAGLGGGFIDREFETRGLNLVEKERVKHDAHKKLESHVAQDY